MNRASLPSTAGVDDDLTAVVIVDREQIRVMPLPRHIRIPRLGLVRRETLAAYSMSLTPAGMWRGRERAESLHGRGADLERKKQAGNWK